eukprot:m.111542 g.111542  ORF g.111542 m.111542 type:complete len:59 (+) comp14063_c0_seq17:2065-2241(+)
MLYHYQGIELEGKYPPDSATTTLSFGDKSNLQQLDANSSCVTYVASALILLLQILATD